MLQDIIAWWRTCFLEDRHSLTAIDTTTIKGSGSKFKHLNDTLGYLATNHARIAIEALFRQCNVSYSPIPLDEDFMTACCTEAIERGYYIDGPNSLRPFIPGGVTMATTAYAHISDKRVRVYIALYTAFLIYLDDVFDRDVSCVTAFNRKFISRQKQDDIVLDDFADLLSWTYNHFCGVSANMIVASTLNLVTALTLERETQGLKLHSSAVRYATFSRVMSGASEAYGLFVFPQGLHISTHVQALPDLMIYINNVNDVLSFYKEDLAGEEVNRVSFLAECLRTSKADVLGKLGREAAQADRRVLQTLTPFPESYRAYESFRQGYIGFHTSLGRYRLKELELN